LGSVGVKKAFWRDLLHEPRGFVDGLDYAGLVVGEHDRNERSLRADHLAQRLEFE
jgi:hypothetical protein